MQSCSPSASSGEVFSGSDVSFDSLAGKAAEPWLAFNATTTSGLPLVPQLPTITAAVPFVPARCTIADLRNLELSAQLVSTRLWLDPIVNRQVSSPRSARDILGLGGLHSSESTSEADDTVTSEVSDPSAQPLQIPAFAPAPARAPQPPAASRAPVVNRWLSKHPILGSMLTPTATADPPPRKAAPELVLTEPVLAGPMLSDMACSPCHSLLRSPAHTTPWQEERHEQPQRPEPPAGGGESRELVSLLQKLAEDAKMRAEAEEDRARRERSERQETSAAVEAAANAAREAALRCAEVQQKARRQASVIAATAMAEKSRQRELAEASSKARCCFQAWLAEAVANRVEARMADACAQTEAEKEQVLLAGCTEDLADCIVDPPPVIPGGFIRALQGEEVWLDIQTGAISGAALWLSQTPPKASQTYVRTFDISLPWSEAHQRHGSEAGSSTATVDPICLEEQLIPPGSFIRSENISLPMSPLHSRLPSPTSRVGTPKSFAGSRGRSPMGSAGRRSPLLPQSPLAASPEARKGLDDEITPEKVLRRISGLMSEMTCMEASLGTLRQELDAAYEAEEGDVSVAKMGDVEAMEATPEPHAGRPGRRVPLRLRQPMPESLSWLQSTGYPMRAASPPGPVGHSPAARSQTTGPRVSLDARHASSRNAGARGRPPSKVGQSRAGARRRSASATRRPPHLPAGRQRYSMPADEWTRTVVV